MKSDKDKPWTWKKYSQGMCVGCYGTCCTMPVEIKKEDLLRLGLCSEDEIEGSNKKLIKRLHKAGILRSYREATGLYMLESRENGDCVFLDTKTRLCTVYDKRPDVCREFPSVGPRPGYCPCIR